MVDKTQTPLLSKRLGKNLAGRRKRLGLTQSQLAERLRVEPETISRFERGVTLPGLATLDKLAAILDTSIADLLDERPGAAYPESRQIVAHIERLDRGQRRIVLAVVLSLCETLSQRDPG